MARFVAVALTLTAAFAIALSPRADAQLLADTNAIDRIVAVVDEDVILRSELDAQVDGVLAQFAQRGGPAPARAEVERQLLERMIDFRLQLARADGTGIRVTDTELEAATARIAEQSNLSPDQMRMALARDGISVEDFRRNLREQLMVDRLRQRFIQQRVAVTQTEIDNFLASGTLRSGEVRLSHILIALPEGASSDEIASAAAKAASVRAEIAGGLDFATAAIRHSQAEQALEGGDLGWRRLDQMPALFGDILVGMKPGDVSQPVRGPGGFHIVTLVEEREGGPALVREFRAQHLMVSPSELLTPEQARARIDDARARIERGEDFGDLARQFSDDIGSKNQGGDMGWFEQDAFGTVFGEQLGLLTDGELSQPFQTEQGSWHLIRRTETREADRSEQRMRQQAEESIRSRKAEDEYAVFLRQLRGEAYIENRIAGAAADADAATAG